MLDGDLTERITFRLSRDDRRVIEDAARAYRMELGRLVRRVVLKRLSELKDDIAKRLNVSDELPL
jgi:uncharacterized protein (DUF1778 family)